MSQIILTSFQVKRGHCPYSLGIQSIAKYCEANGIKVHLLSLPLNIDESVDKLISFDPDICGFSANYITESYVINIIDQLKKVKGNKIKIIIGGPSVTYSDKNSKIRNCNADLFVKGDGEVAFYTIIKSNFKDIVDGRKRISGVSSKKVFDEEINKVDLKILPSPFPISFKTRHVYWETVRGCAFKASGSGQSGTLSAIEGQNFYNITIE